MICVRRNINISTTTQQQQQQQRRRGRRMLTVQKTLVSIGRLVATNTAAAATATGSVGVARYSSKKKSKDPAENNEHLMSKLHAKIDPTFLDFRDDEELAHDFGEDVEGDLLEEYKDEELAYDADEEIEDFRDIDDFDQHDTPDDAPLNMRKTKRQNLLFGDKDFDEQALDGLDENEFDEDALDREYERDEDDEEYDRPVEMDDFYNDDETNQYFEGEDAMEKEALQEDDDGMKNKRFHDLLAEVEEGDAEEDAEEQDAHEEQMRKYRDIIGPVVNDPDVRGVRVLYNAYRLALDDPRPLDPVIKMNIYDAYMEDPVYYNPYQLSKIYHIHPNRIAAIIRFQQIYLKEVEAGEEVFDDLEIAMTGYFGTREEDEYLGQFEADERKMQKYWLLNGKENMFSIVPKKGKRVDPIHERPENVPPSFPEKPVYFRGPTLEKPKRKNLIFIDKSRNPFTGYAQADPLILISAIDGSLRTPSTEERSKILEKHTSSQKDRSPHALLKLPLNYKDHDAYHKGKKNKEEESTTTEEQL
ncbi:hypothetical protein DFA_01461 [Cavenderia fasciculata]|uniref:Uncharacterized protein n=1 Tax=Cavenderia fasciculata TaxID=261658 RepID=F4PSU7_CACFS|nr:uncharacterized protein DFA_01461 [Cavenderia fasciculata]EGG21575.1 hypothetical protein DFA_01461 [Cavenderia fasciculata]|eukprot:XP_004359425.1 hypothetical protein DFA_01461 [Cavenderia fasciculata]